MWQNITISRRATFQMQLLPVLRDHLPSVADFEVAIPVSDPLHFTHRQLAFLDAMTDSCKLSAFCGWARHWAKQIAPEVAREAIQGHPDAAWALVNDGLAKIATDTSKEQKACKYPPSDTTLNLQAQRDECRWNHLQHQQFVCETVDVHDLSLFCSWMVFGDSLATD
eukprot:TRINITY_DN77640_c0_g1_i1.p1 TRINITY_DN77640_c0_g1~~TRINITY_DN77640_c0_g1_i1.p1  ORF type:complete len:167 (+),score=21.31 TRINITY_DN77640_c0_g1_i1:200-700(+)